MDRRKINILTFILIVFAIICFITLIYLCFRNGHTAFLMLQHASESNDNAWETVYRELFAKNISAVIVCLFAAIFCVGVAVFLIYLLYRINKTELLAATEDINAYRERKAAERNARRKAIAEKKKAAIEKELAALNTPEDNDFSEK